jgi:hypothetical protein
MSANGDGKDIPDGYTLNGYIMEIPGVSRALSFIYRPVDPKTAIRYRVRKNAAASNQALTPEDREIAVEMLELEMAVKNVASWDLRKNNGEVIEGPPSVAAVCHHCTQYQYNRLLEIVNGGFASDRRPSVVTGQAIAAGETPEPEPTGNLAAAVGN